MHVVSEDRLCLRTLGGASGLKKIRHHCHSLNTACADKWNSATPTLSVLSCLRTAVSFAGHGRGLLLLSHIWSHTDEYVRSWFLGGDSLPTPFQLTPFIEEEHGVLVKYLLQHRRTIL
jgi:hypothetical protein